MDRTYSRDEAVKATGKDMLRLMEGIIAELRRASVRHRPIGVCVVVVCGVIRKSAKKEVLSRRAVCPPNTFILACPR